MNKEAQQILDRVIELRGHDFYFKGIHEDDKIVQERKDASDEYRKILENLKPNYSTFKKGDKVAIVLAADHMEKTKMSRKQLRDSLFAKSGPKKHIIEVVEIHAPIKTRIKKDQWVGDGYEDVEETTMKYITPDGKYIITDSYPNSNYMIKID